ncbi:hypothetical protein [Sphaerisporangium fuscum]|uniref:hypothetical protein n=1 Tax=Sphaerisporangium fuscum TaxID=2835868 RepID=UPI001BDC364E|nr:hypothetical protein [Sphaerisporangium fuscum]
MDIRRTALRKAGAGAGDTAGELRAALDELLAAISAEGPIPQSDDISAMIGVACDAMHEIAVGSVRSAVTSLDGRGEQLTVAAARYEGAEQDSLWRTGRVERAARWV